jgi:hypothetical protein
MTQEILDVKLTVDNTNNEEDDNKGNLDESTTFWKKIDVLQHILSFVGKGQYRFIAAVNRDFKLAYLELFSKNKQTYYNASTIEHANISLEDGTVDNDRKSKLYASAARHGSLSTLQYLVSTFHLQCDIKITRIATQYGHINILKYLLEVRQYRNDNGIGGCYAAAEYGQLEILKWARKNELHWCERTCGVAAEKCHLEVLQWAHFNGCPWDTRTCTNAATNGHLALLQWARRHGCPWNSNTCSSAAFHGHLEILMWAKENGCPWNSETCSSAALWGRLAILKWARENGCPWNSKTCSSAASRGHLAVLKWARGNGCPWDQETCKSALKFGHLKVLEWAQGNGCPFTSTAV